jgi:hypothetical protein
MARQPSRAASSPAQALRVRWRRRSTNGAGDLMHGTHCTDGIDDFGSSAHFFIAIAEYFTAQ